MPTKAELKHAFRERGLAPKKWMGQNLLTDLQYLKKIVDAALIEPGETIVEVGAGLGVLTKALLDRGAKVLALEIDAGFFEVLKEKLGSSPDVELIHADALKFDFRALSASLGKLRVVANLPYSISSRLIFMSCENRDIFSSMSILLQKEVAERLIARPGTKAYGVLTVLLGAHAKAELLFDIPGKAFYPKPTITSTMVRIAFLEPPPIPVLDSRLLTRLVKASFSGRRKTLWNNLRERRLGLSSEHVVAGAMEAGIDLSRRAESLSPQEFAHFSDALAKPKK